MVVPLIPFRVSVCGLSDVGCVRQKNEDMWDQIPEENFFILADGMGGHRAGDVAARETTRSLIKIMRQKLASVPEEKRQAKETSRLLRQSIEEVNRIVYDLGKTEEEWRGMGTTLCCVHMEQDGLVYAHVGDSRIYRYRNGKLQQLTNDHSLLQDLIQRGQIHDQPRGGFLYKNIITKAIGTEPIVEPSVNVTDLLSGDLILMCSDGLTDVLSPEEIQETLHRSSGIRAAAESLVSEVKSKGAPDNVTVVLIKAQEGHAATHLSR